MGRYPRIGNYVGSMVGSGGAPSSPNFVSTWDTTLAGSASDTILLPITAGPTVAWGDGTVNNSNTHTYAVGGIYTVTISGTIQGFSFANSGDKAKITDISNWGTFDLTISSSFYGCSALNITATDAPTITTTSFYRMFRNCSSFTTIDLSAWDVSSVTSFQEAFESCPNLVTAGISNWTTSALKSLRSTFNQNGKYNEDLFWDVSGVTDMSFMFQSGVSFNGNIDGWVTTSVTTLRSFLNDGASFNRDISGWDVSKVDNAREAFRKTALNQDISGWTTTLLTNMQQMFDNADSFDQDISGWDINQATSLSNFMVNATGLSTANYDALLIGWDAQGAMSFSGTANFGGSKYTSGGAAETARTSLISKWGGITDGGAA